ncbi:MAG: hypothetical protein ACREDU_12420, partial [Methylocella sp.]
LEAAQAANLADRLVKRLEDPNETNGYRLPALQDSLSALAARLEAGQAANLADRVLKRIEDPKETDSKRVYALEYVLSALEARTQNKDAAVFAARLVKKLEDPVEIAAYGLQQKRRRLAVLALNIPEARQTRLFALAELLLDPIPDPDAKSEQSPNNRELLIALCERLTSQDLAEVLKWPFAVGEAEKIVLSSLEKKTGKQFDGDLWKFVDQAESLGIKDTSLPAKRPRFEDALRELDSLREKPAPG